MDEIMKISSATRARTAPLRFIYDKVSVHVRGLASLGVSPINMKLAYTNHSVKTTLCHTSTNCDEIYQPGMEHGRIA